MKKLLLAFILLAGSVFGQTTQSVTTGQQFTITSTAEGTLPFTYVWYKDNVAISGATSATYVVASATTANSGVYKLVVTNSLGSSESNLISVSVTPPAVAPSNVVIRISVP
jgi:hypothetical protein